MSNNIKALRTASGFTQQELADKAQISKRTVEEWEANRKPPTDVYKLHRIAKVLGCTIEELINFDDDN
jgi:transcriptional regulator with XRE-family HTH domain